MRMHSFVHWTVAACALTAGSASAQTAERPQTTSPAPDDDNRIGDIVVTAQKRSESLQNVPTAVTAFSQAAIENYRLNDVRSVADRTPNFTIGQQGPATPILTIRGIGSSDREAGSDRSVVTFIDEVYIGRSGASTFDLFDLKQIEVLRGPQGSLFGKNAVGGALSLTTNAPSSMSAGVAELTVGNMGRAELRGAVTGALTDTLSGRLSVSATRRDGFYYSRVFNRRLDDSEGISARGKLKYAPSDDLTVTLSADGSKDRVDGIGRVVGPGEVPLATFVSGISTTFSPGSLPTSNPYEVGSNAVGRLDRSIYGGYVRVDWNPGYGTVTFLPAYRGGYYTTVDDVSAVLLTGTGPTSRGQSSIENDSEKYDAFSGELRFASPQGHRLEWLTGLYFLDERTHRIQIRDRLSNGSASRPIWDQLNTTRSYAAFASATYRPTGFIDLTVGGRYTQDDKSFDISAGDTLTADQRAQLAAFYGKPTTLSPLSSPYVATPSKNFGEFTPDASVTIRPLAGVSIYGRIAKGFKSGGFNGLAANALQANLAFNPETAVNYEVGLKTRLFDDRLQVNTTAFLIDFDNLQLRDRTFTVPGDLSTAIVTIVNAGKARTKGIESEVIAKPARGLTLSGQISVLNARITAVNAGSTLLVGSALPRSPSFSLTTSAGYETRIWNGAKVGGHVEFRHVGNLNYDLNDALASAQAPYSLLNARVSYSPRSGPWTLSFWANNLTDRVYVTDAQQGGFYAVQQLSEPRTFGATLRLSY